MSARTPSSRTMHVVVGEEDGDTVVVVGAGVAHGAAKFSTARSRGSLPVGGRLSHFEGVLDPQYSVRSAPIYCRPAMTAHDGPIPCPLDSRYHSSVTSLVMDSLRSDSRGPRNPPAPFDVGMAHYDKAPARPDEIDVRPRRVTSRADRFRFLP